MKEKIILLFLILIFVILLVSVSIFIRNKEKFTNTTTQIVQSDNKEESKVTEVTEANFNEEVEESDKIVLIDFYATWCNPCKQLSPIIDKISLEREDVKFVRIDVDENNNLATKYEIMYMPTLVVIKNGEEVDRAIGLVNEEKIIELINK